MIKTPRFDNAAPRLLDLDPERVRRADRPPYAIVDIGSNSVRLLVYDQLGRAPMPRFNEKSLLRLGEGLAETGAIAPEGFRRTVEAVRRFRAIADAMGVARIDATATEAMRRASNGPALAAAIAAESGLKVRILTGEEEARYATLGVISGFFRPVGLGRRHGRRQPRGRGGGRRPGRRPLGQPAARRAAGRGAARRGLRLRQAPGRRDPARRPQVRRRAVRSSIRSAAAGDRWPKPISRRSARRSRPFTAIRSPPRSRASSPSFSPAKRRRGSPRCRASRRGGRARFRRRRSIIDRVLKRLAPERVVFSALGLREGLLYSQLTRAEQYLDPLVEGAQLIGLPLARVPDFAPALASWTAGLFRGETTAGARLRVAVCALSDIAWRDAPDLRAEESFRRLLEFPFIGIDHVERVFVAAAIHARYAGRTDASWLEPATASSRRRAAPRLHPRTGDPARLPVFRRRAGPARERRVFASTQRACGSKSGRPRARPTAKWSSTVSACSPAPSASSAARSS